MSRRLFSNFVIALTLFLNVVVINCAVAADAPKPNAPAEPADMKPLFNGKDLTGWEGNPELWSFKDGVITGKTNKDKPIKSNTFLIWKDGEVGDFELRLSYKIDSVGNSGVQYRSKRVEDKNDKYAVGGYQYDITFVPEKCGFLYHERGDRDNNTRLVPKGNETKYLCRVGEKTVINEKGMSELVGSLGDADALAKTFKPNDWNELIVIAKGNHIQHFRNGIQIVDVVDNDPKASLKKGIVAFQLHKGKPMTVQFKDARLKQYDSK